jgi:hypothetical protein
VTDPWLDMLLMPTPDPATMSEQDKGWYYKDIWSNFSVSDVIIDRWPAYKALRTKRDAAATPLTQDDLLQLKGYFQLAWFDPDFLKGPVTLPDGDVVNLSDLVSSANDTYTLKRPFTEADCQRLVVEEYKVLNNIVAVHKKYIYDAVAKTGQIEVMTTPVLSPHPAAARGHRPGQAGSAETPAARHAFSAAGTPSFTSRRPYADLRAALRQAGHRHVARRGLGGRGGRQAVHRQRRQVDRDRSQGPRAEHAEAMGRSTPLPHRRRHGGG